MIKNSSVMLFSLYDTLAVVDTVVLIKYNRLKETWRRFMALAFFYIADGKMYRYSAGKTDEVKSGVLESYINKVKDSAKRTEWKYSGSGARFTETYRPNASAESAVSSVRSCVNCVDTHNGDVIYSMNIDNVCGIYRKREGEENEGIVISSSDSAYVDFDILNDRMVLSSYFAGESHIGVLDMDDTYCRIYTEGATRDTSPVWSKTHRNRIYYSCAGLPIANDSPQSTDETHGGFGQIMTDMYMSASTSSRGPSSICVLDISAGTVDDVLADDKYDFTHPYSSSDGALYYIRKPYREDNGSGALGCLLDLLMLPVRLITALFGFFNAFSVMFSGKTLTKHSDVKKRDEKKIMIDGNLINAEKELRENQKRADENPGIIPHSWELRRLDRNGNDTLIRAGVAAYRVFEENADIVFSNGSAVIRIDKNGKEKKLISVENVTYIK